MDQEHLAALMTGESPDFNENVISSLKNLSYQRLMELLKKYAEDKQKFS
jgi:hypothetical protein